MRRKKQVQTSLSHKGAEATCPGSWGYLQLGVVVRSLQDVRHQVDALEVTLLPVAGWLGTGA